MVGCELTLSVKNSSRAVDTDYEQDKFGLSWQIIPREYVKLQEDANEKQMVAMHEEMFKMNKLEIEPFRKAFEEAA